MKICTADQMQSIDQRTIEQYGIPGMILMERAGLAVCKAILSRIPCPESAVIVAGTGNNGGDGFVVARELQNQGLAVQVYLLGDPEKLKGDARSNFEILRRLGISIHLVQSAGSLRFGSTPKHSIIIDSIFGTGLHREVTGLYQQVIRKINRSGRAVVAVDIPSGVSSDTGHILGEAVRAEETITFGLPKRGHFLYPGALYCGRLTVADIGFPQKAIDSEDITLQTIEPYAVAAKNLAKKLPERPASGHKGTFGHLLAIAGSRGKIGAASLVGLAALRAGCGLVTLAVPESLTSSISRKFPEAMTYALPETTQGTISATAVSELIRFSKKVSAVAIGPGLSVSGDTIELVRKLLIKLQKPTIIDADAINTLMGDAEFLKQIKHQIILTPHPAEFGRLIDRETVEVQSDRIGMAESFAKKYGHVLVLKGAHTLVAGPKEGVFMNLTGNSGMATAGSGDALTGIIGAMLAAGMPSLPAALAGVNIHGTAGDIAAKKKTERSLTASDIINALPSAFQALQAGCSLDNPPRDGHRVF